MIDFLFRVLFESAPWLLFLCAMATSVAVAIHRRRMTRASARGIWITLGICAALLVIQRVVVTHREQLEATIVAMAQAVDDGDVDRLAEHVAEDMQWRAAGRQEFLDDVTRRLTATQINKPRISQVEAVVEGDAAQVTFQAFCDVKDGSMDQYSLPSHWRLHFVRRGGRWLMDRVLDARLFPGGLPTSGGIDLMPYIR